MVQTIQVKVTPGSSREEVRVETLEDGSVLYRVYVRAVAEDGKANKAVIALLARHFGVAKRDVEILRGGSGRHKSLLIRNALL